MGFFGIKPATDPQKFRLMLGSASQTANVSIPIANYDPLVIGQISSNTTSSITFSDISNIGSLLNSNSAYAIQLTNGRYFYIDTSATITNANSTATIITNLGFPIINSGESLSGSCRIRRVISFYDLINGGFVVSGAFVSGASGTGDEFYAYTEGGAIFTMIFRTASTWRNSSNITKNDYPVNAFSQFARKTTPSSQLIIELPLSNIV